MNETDTRDSLPSDTPSGQDPRRHTDDMHSDDTPDRAAPDPGEVKAEGAGSAAEKDPDQWVTGDEPMTGPQASYLGTLAQQAGVEPPTGLSKSEASRAIDELQARAGRGGG
jgi:hypothetical protein